MASSVQMGHINSTCY